ncbi:hypothetical protein STANM309S_00508 [Streptomyces tanashiensis]
MPGGVGDAVVAPLPERDGLPGEAQIGRDGLGRHVRPVPAPQRPLGLVLGLQLLDERPDGVGVPLTGVLRDDVPLGVDHRTRASATPARRTASRSRAPRVVEHGVMHLVPLDGIDDGLMLGLVHELRRVHPDDHEGVAVLLLQIPKLVEDVQAVHTAKCPEISSTHLPRRSARVSSLPPVFSQPPLPISSGARTRARRGAGAGVGRRGGIVHGSSLPSAGRGRLRPQRRPNAPPGNEPLPAFTRRFG